MDYEEIVLNHFPNAEAREEAPIYQHGQASAIMPRYWSIHPDNDLYSEELASGRTEELAWKHAAARVQKLAPIAS